MHMLRLTDLREILRYVPQFRDRVFVIALDGAVVEDDNFRNLLLDIALLRSLRIGVALVHGAGHQIRRLAEQTGQTPSNIDGTGVTDAATLQLALTAANRVTHEILEGLAATDLRGAYGNAVVAHPAGILRGVDHQFTGRVERVDTSPCCTRCWNTTSCRSSRRWAATARAIPIASIPTPSPSRWPWPCRRSS